MGILQYHLTPTTPTVGKNKGKLVYSARTANHGKISFEDFCKELADGSTVDQADVEAVLRRMAIVIPRLVERGFSVDAGAMGIFRANIGSKQVLSEEEFRSEMISHPKVIFTPRVAFKNSLRGVSFERVPYVPKAKKKKKGDAPESASGGSTESPSVPGIRPGHNL